MTPKKDDHDYEGMLDKGFLLNFKRIDADLMKDIERLKSCLAEFDCYRHAWAEIIGNNNPPGRDSAYCKRLEVLQGYALLNLDSAAMALRLRVRGGEA